MKKLNQILRKINNQLVKIKVEKTSQYLNKKNLKTKIKKFTLNLKENLRRVLIRKLNNNFNLKQDR